MGPPVVLRSADVETELPGHREAIAAFFRGAAQHQHDGMLVVFEDERVAATLADLTGLTRRFYLTLSRMFTSVYIDPAPEQDRRWYAMIEGERFFLVSFAPCYPENSPRHTHGDGRTYFLLQPASTFARNATAIERVRERTHRAFMQAGKPYDSVLANLENDMFKAVMPIDPIDQPVVWWESAGSTP